ncbi:hypothetical protein DFH06DRAFT_1139070 [Mycena polygramma]|nr:hypothetical protein DFH06DRAFT_1139070 [Mycena polygramma]
MRDNPLEQFFQWATTAPQPPQNNSAQNQHYGSGSTTGSSSSGPSSHGTYHERGRGRGQQVHGRAHPYGHPYGPLHSYDYHSRSLSLFSGRQQVPHHQDARHYPRGAGSGYRGGHHNRGRGNRYEAYPRDHNRHEEERLRTRALQGRIKTPAPAVPWARSMFPPDIDKSEKDENEHPLCPLEHSPDDDESDYGSESEAPTMPSGWKTTELARQADAVAHEERGSRTYTRFEVAPSDAIGLWAGKTLQTKEEAANILRWIARTEASAFHFMHCERVRLGSDPTIIRTEGQVYLLQRQNAASEQYWLATTGRRKGPAKYDPPAAYKDAGTRAEEDQYVYLGTAMLGEDTMFVILTELAYEDSEVRSGSHTKLLEAARMYDNMEHRLWPHGFRVNEREYASPRVRWATAHRDDIAAWYTINALAPRRNRIGTSIERAKFMEVLICLLSIAGTYNRIQPIWSE